VSFGARAIIRLDALRHNLKVIRNSVSDCKIIAVVKANAYGHGLIDVASALGEADALAVARLSEASKLRESGLNSPIVVLTGINSPDDLQLALKLNCELVVHSFEQIEILESTTQRCARIWLKIDTGMHRLGIAMSDTQEAIERLGRCCDQGALGIMSHLASADDPDDGMTLQQIARLKSATAGFSGDISLGNSAAIFAWSDALHGICDGRPAGSHWVRPGIALYGVSPLGSASGEQLGLIPVMQFESRLIAVKRLRAGEGVGYGATWQAKSDTVIGLISAGYGDGYSRYCPSGTPVLVAGRRVALAGVVSMDSCAVDLGVDAADRPGEQVVLWGDNLSVEEIARCAGTIPYVLLSGVTHRDAPLIVQ
jgi:alanine racemase